MASRARLGAAGGSAAADVVPCRTNTSRRLSAGGWSGRKSRGLAKLCSGAERLARADWRSLQGVSEPLFETVTDGSKSDRCRVLATSGCQLFWKEPLREVFRAYFEHGVCLIQ